MSVGDLEEAAAKRALSYVAEIIGDPEWGKGAPLRIRFAFMLLAIFSPGRLIHAFTKVISDGVKGTDPALFRSDTAVARAVEGARR